MERCNGPLSLCDSDDDDDGVASCTPAVIKCCFSLYVVATAACVASS